ncbi:hypothetical protein LTR85_003750 [Meristemomyces frigidus]|nr:hypothetical protein LTR85_003750 [Meristemomyces frigidus]
MSKEVAIVAIAHTAPGKLEKFKEAVTNATAWIEENEPETLQFEVYEEAGRSEDGVRISLFERYVSPTLLFRADTDDSGTSRWILYASQEALEHHEQSESYKHFFHTVRKEELLVGGPQMLKGRFVCAFRR